MLVKWPLILGGLAIVMMFLPVSPQGVAIGALISLVAGATAALREQLDTVRHERIAVEVEEYMPRLACIAAPVRSAHGHTIGAVSVSVTADDFTSRADALERVVRRFL